MHPKIGDRITLINTGNRFVEGALAIVGSFEEWGAHTLTDATRTGQYRAAWEEMAPAAEVPLKKRLMPVAKEMTGDYCPDCQSPNMVRTGTCNTCQDCGSTSGGCS
jgi:hypothetical protein